MSAGAAQPFGQREGPATRVGEGPVSRVTRCRPYLRGLLSQELSCREAPMSPRSRKASCRGVLTLRDVTTAPPPALLSHGPSRAPDAAPAVAIATALLARGGGSGAQAAGVARPPRRPLIGGRRAAAPGARRSPRPAPPARAAAARAAKMASALEQFVNSVRQLSAQGEGDGARRGHREDGAGPRGRGKTAKTEGARQTVRVAGRRAGAWPLARRSLRRGSGALHPRRGAARAGVSSGQPRRDPGGVTGHEGPAGLSRSSPWVSQGWFR